MDAEQVDLTLQHDPAGNPVVESSSAAAIAVPLLPVPQTTGLEIVAQDVDDVVMQPAAAELDTSQTETVPTPEQTGDTSGPHAHDDQEETAPNALYNTIDLSEAAIGKVQQTLNTYRARVKALEAGGQKKPDMVAYSELKKTLTPPDCHGHIPGVKVGDEFFGKGELAILGIHTQIVRGIHFKTGEPAYAIVLSGGYKDDEDEGEEFVYTGEGGQKKNKQVDDQDSNVRGNLALINSCRTGIPVRVCRAKTGPNRERLYVYDGLYTVTNCWMERSKGANAGDRSGPWICRFTMKAKTGEAAASTQVTFRHWDRVQRLQVVNLAQGAAVTGRKRKRVDIWDLEHFKVADYKKHLERNKASLGIKVMDISGGQEDIPIPLINEVNSRALDESFSYIKDIDFKSPEDRKIAEDSCKLFSSKFGRSRGCGVKWMGSEAYMESGQLLSTHPLGVLECGGRCRGQKCMLNRVVKNGIRVPLQVFMTEKKGWGVRSPCDIPIGMYVCSYVGVIMSNDKAEQLRGADDYLFDLDHYLQIMDEFAQDPTGAAHPPQEQPASAAAAPPPQEQPAGEEGDAAVPPPQEQPAAGEEGAAAVPSPQEQPAGVDGAAAVPPPQEQPAAGQEGAATAPPLQEGPVPMDAAAPSASALSMVASPPLLALSAAAAAVRASAGDDVSMSDAVAVVPSAVVPAPPLPVLSAVVRASAGDDVTMFDAVAVNGEDVAGPSNWPSKAEDIAAAERMHSVRGQDRAGPSLKLDDVADPSAVEAIKMEDGASEVGDDDAEGAGDEETERGDAVDENVSLDTMPPLPSNRTSDINHLVVDACQRGNVARFINHSCNGNLTVQAVMSGKLNGALAYYVSLFASRHIKRGEELCYDYGYKAGSVLGKQMSCHCGEPNCRLMLL